MFNFQGPWSLKVGTASRRVHPFPFRTRKLSSGEPKILCRQQHGKIGRRRHFGCRLQRRTKKHEKGTERLQKRFFSEKKKEDKIHRIFSIFIQVLFLLSFSSSRSTKYAFGTRTRGLHLKPFAKTRHPERGCSSVGRAPALQAGGHGFESHHLHQSGHRRKSHGLVAQLVRAPA